MQKYFFILLLFSLFSCNKIENSHSLNQEDIALIKKLKLLDQNETILKFYSEYKKQIAGNFFTDKRAASYWVDKRDSSKTIIQFAYYSDIAKIDTVYYAGLTYCPYALITKKDHTTFKVCVDGNKQEIRSFFEELLLQWKKNR